MQTVTVFGQAAIANLAVAKDLFNVAEWMFHFGPDAGLEFLGLQLSVVQFFTRAGALGNEPRDVFAIFMLITLLNPKITGITKHAPLITVEKVAGGHNVVNVGCRGIDAMDQAERVIDTNVHLQSGKDSVLPHHPPLRTVRESHPSYGSSLSTA